MESHNLIEVDDYLFNNVVYENLIDWCDSLKMYGESIEEDEFMEIGDESIEQEDWFIEDDEDELTEQEDWFVEDEFDANKK